MKDHPGKAELGLALPYIEETLADMLAVVTRRVMAEVDKQPMDTELLRDLAAEKRVLIRLRGRFRVAAGFKPAKEEA